MGFFFLSFAAAVVFSKGRTLLLCIICATPRRARSMSILTAEIKVHQRWLKCQREESSEMVIIPSFNAELNFFFLRLLVIASFNTQVLHIT